MEFHFTPLRTGLLVALLVVFALLGGFTPPWIHLGLEPGSLPGRPWLSCVLMFVAGAGMSTVVDHWVGMVPPSNLRLLYVIGGVFLMTASVLWYRSMLTSWAMTSGA